jgi:hypothetical protein
MRKEYRPFTLIGMKIIFIPLLFFFTGCGITRHPAASHKMFSGSPAPDWVYEPEYYTYRNGQYNFVKGHYRRVLSRKNYWKRSLKCFGRTGDYTAAR